MAKRGKAHDSFSHSMTDLMAGVAVLFLLIAAIFMVRVARSSAAVSKQLQTIKASEHDAKQELIDLMNALKVDTELKGLELLYDANTDPFLLTIVFDRNQLKFDSGGCSIEPDVLAAMKRPFGLIFERVCRTANRSDFIQSITLEGHTDGVPFFPRDRSCGVEPTRGACAQTSSDPSCAALGFANNVRLSAARAQNVFFAVRDMLGQREDIGTCLDTKFVVAGRGPVEPVDGVAWKAGGEPIPSERNRRVVIKVRAIARSTLTASAAP